MEQPPKYSEVNHGMAPAIMKEGQAPPGYPVQPPYGYPRQPGYPQAPPYGVQPQQGYAQPMQGVVQPTAVVVQQPSPPVAVPDIGLAGIATRSLVAGIVLFVTGLAYFITGCIASGVPNLVAEGVLIGLINMASGISGIFMKFKLMKIDTIDSLLKHTWIFVTFGSISLITALAAIRFVATRVALASSLYDQVTRQSGKAVADFLLGQSAASITFVILIFLLSLVFLSCSGSIRRRIAASLASSRMQVAVRNS